MQQTGGIVTEYIPLVEVPAVVTSNIDWLILMQMRAW